MKTLFSLPPSALSPLSGPSSLPPSGPFSLPPTSLWSLLPPPPSVSYTSLPPYLSPPPSQVSHLERAIEEEPTEIFVRHEIPFNLELVGSLLADIGESLTACSTSQNDHAFFQAPTQLPQLKVDKMDDITSCLDLLCGYITSWSRNLAKRGNKLVDENRSLKVPNVTQATPLERTASLERTVSLEWMASLEQTMLGADCDGLETVCMCSRARKQSLPLLSGHIFSYI